MADGYERSRSLSTGSLNDTYHSSPTNYVEARVNYEEEGMCRAFKDVAKLALPITVTSLFVSALLFCNLVWIGRHASKNEYAGAALGNMLVNVMGNSIIIGMTTGLDTQCGQAFGAQIYKMVGVFLQRSLLISQFVVVIIGIVFWNGDKILIGLGQDHDASKAAGTFCRVFIASLWPIAMFANLRRFLQAQRKVVFIPIAVFMGLTTQIIALLILVNWQGFGYEGACFALPTSYWAMFGTLFLFTRWKKLHVECWPGWGNWAFKDWRVFLKLTVPGTLMLCAEWWAFEVLALVAGTMNKPGGDCDSDNPTHCYDSATYVAAFTTCLNVLGIFIRIPLGISFACAVLVSNKLGAKLGNSARLVFNAAIILSISLCSLCAAFIFFFPQLMAKIYTKDPSIQHVVTETLPYLAVYFAIDSFQRCCAGGTRGMGRQAWGAVIYAVSYYCIGMPLGIWFGKSGFFGHGDPMYLKGLWVGAGISVTVCSFFFICLRLCVNWDREVVRAQRRLEREQVAIEQFKEDLKRGMDDETMNKLLREPHPSVNEGHYIKYSEGGHQHIHITEDSVSGKTYDNVDNIEYYEDMTFGADENDATLNEHTLDSNVLAFRSNSGTNSLRNDLTSPLNPNNNETDNNNNYNNYNNNNVNNVTPNQAPINSTTSMNSLPSASYITMKKSTSQPGYGYAVNSQESVDFSSKHHIVTSKDSMDDRTHEINGTVSPDSQPPPPSKMDMNGNISIDVANDDDIEMNEENDNDNDDNNDNENENDDENDNEIDEDNEQNGTINGSVDKNDNNNNNNNSNNNNNNNNNQVGTPRKGGLPKKST